MERQSYEKEGFLNLFLFCFFSNSFSYLHSLRWIFVKKSAGDVYFPPDLLAYLDDLCKEINKTRKCQCMLFQGRI